MRDEILRAVDAIAPDGVVEVRALAENAVHSGYFDDRTELAERAEVLDADPSVAGIYITLNPVNPALLSRRANRIKMRLSKKDATTADADIIRRRWLPVDIDPVRPSGVSSTGEEHDLALATAEKIAAWLAEQGFPDPVRADSGNGAHLLYRIDLPNDPAATDLVKNCLAVLDALFSNEKVTVDTANHNAARIWKLYGTVSRKGDNTPERPHRRATVLAVPDEITDVPPERLTRLAGLLPCEEPAPKRTGGSVDLAGWLCDHGIAVRSTKPYRGGTLYVLEDCPFSSDHKDGAFAIRFANGAIFVGCHHTSCGGGRQRWPELRDHFERRERRASKPEKKKEELPAPPPPDDEHRRRAMAILKDGDPLGFLLDTFNRTHVGDRVVAECLAMSLASQSVENSSGLHVAISGSSGKGKSHACTTMLSLIPEDFTLKGSVSDKALFYDEDLRPGTVLVFDDRTLSEDLQEVLKSATSDFRRPVEHRTLTVDRKKLICRMPERCVWWLAQVEDPGDDQVMNRMLTVWIDDSKEQDRRVLAHLLRRESRRASAAATEDERICRAIWSILKAECVEVRVPFAERIRFSDAGNRRDPVIFLDLVKAHAALFRSRREGTEDGALLAVREDFDAAVRLYTAINGEDGAQAPKLTRNEAAALATIAGAHLTEFTIRQLQQLIGLSYHQVYRLLHGYMKRGVMHAGLLEKCPAVSYVDTAVTVEEETGIRIQRREQQFSFDPERYREWRSRSTIWLADVCDVAPVCDTFATGRRKDDDDDPGEDSGNGDRNAGKQTAGEPCLRRIRGTESTSGSGDDDPKSAVPGEPVANSDENTRESDGSANPRQSEASLFATPCRKVVQTGATVANPTGSGPPPVTWPASSVRRGEYLGSTCLTNVKRPANVLPLPGLLDHRSFERVRVDLGRCTICDTAKAVYRSHEAQASICEGCYARLVREWNRGKGVR